MHGLHRLGQLLPADGRAGLPVEARGLVGEAIEILSRWSTAPEQQPCRLVPTNDFLRDWCAGNAKVLHDELGHAILS